MPTPVRKAGFVAGALALSLISLSTSAGAVTTTPDAAEFTAAEAEKRAELSGNNINGLKVRLDRAGTQRTMLIGLRTDDAASLHTYCVELHTPIDRDHPNMEEVPWDAYPDPDSPFHRNRDRINWILHHSYPAADLADIEAVVDHQFHNGLSEQEAIAATQAAIWHFSDDGRLSRSNPTPDNPTSAGDVRELYNYLTGEDNVGIGDQPAPELAIAPAALAGESGTVIGPFDVTTTADTAALTGSLPTGVTLIDGDSQLLGDTVTDGTQIFVDVPEGTADGAGTVQLSASANLSIGRLFVGERYHEHPTQSLILAASENTKLEVAAEVSWVQPEQPEEPEPTEEPTEEPTTEPTPTPEPTETPEPTQTPEPTETPSPTDTPEPTVPPEDDEDEDEELPDTGAEPGLLLGAALLAVAGGLLLARRRAQA